ncbi:MAG: HAD-IB family hydrolase [Bacteroidota bacterium]
MRTQTVPLFLFDFDGTLTREDSLFAFLKFVSTPRTYRMGFLRFAPRMVLMKLGLLDAGPVKEAFIAHFLAGKTRQEIRTLANRFYQEVLPGIMRPKAVKYLEVLASQPHRRLLVSASLDLWLQPFAEANKMELICTQAEFKDDVFTGKFATPNCNGPEKAKRIQAYLNVSEYDQIFAFGDSKGDREMLALGEGNLDAFQD